MIVEILDPESLEPVREYHVTSIENASAKWTAIRKLTHVVGNIPSLVATP